MTEEERKENWREYMQKYRETHPRHDKPRKKPYTAKEKEYKHKYYLEHKDQVYATIKKWRAEHPEKVSEAQKRYREKNREKVRAYEREYYLKRCKEKNEGKEIKSSDSKKTLLRAYGYDV